MKCPKCGKPINQKANKSFYCLYCGYMENGNTIGSISEVYDSDEKASKGKGWYCKTCARCYKEKRNYYYAYQEDSKVVENIMRDFGLIDTKNAHIINGHIPVEKINGENPLKADNKLIVIDGGFSKAYQKTTGIAGYTLISGSTGMRIVAHEPFTSLEDAIANNTDIHSTIEIKETVRKRITISDIDKGRELKREIYFLKLLIRAYDLGIIKENNEFKYIKVQK